MEFRRVRIGSVSRASHSKGWGAFLDAWYGDLAVMAKLGIK